MKRKERVNPKEATNKQSQYKAAYSANEIDANKHTSFVNGAAGVLSLIIWALYLARIFTIPDHFFLAVAIVFPVIALIMFTPLFLVRTKFIKHPGYKYFILFSLMIVIIVLNILIPKHSLLFWPFVILIANHYYKPTLGRIVYGVSIVSMLICLYLGMFFGEFDENLFGGGVIMPDGTIGTVDTFEERLELLRHLTEIGNNRYIKVLVYYFLPRAMIITLFFIVSNLLNRRTYKLLDKEIKIHDEQEKVRTELGVAKEIQLNTLPEQVVDSKDIEIIGELKAAKEVGGDLYDYLELDEDHVAILIGDVSDKGVPAAMFMMRTITSFRDFASASKKPSEILKAVNASINKGNKKSMFVTCFLAIVDKRNGKVVFANAGHNPPIIGHNGHYRYLKCRSGLLLGCFKQTILFDEEITLEPGESITLYTDGVTEAKDIKGGMFGEKRFLEVFNSKNYSCTVELHHAIKDEMAGFVKEAPQSDDVTLLTLRYLGSGHTYAEKTFQAEPDKFTDLISFISSYLNENNLPDEFRRKLLVVGDELFSNIIKHGYEGNPGEIYVRMLYGKDDGLFTLTVIDKAKPFNPLDVDITDEGIDIEKEEVGGLGIKIIKSIMTDCAYDRVNDKNVLVLKRHFK